jgi:hypothetical protein
MKVAGLVYCLFLVGCSKQAEVERLFGGVDNVEAMKHSPTVEVFRLRKPTTQKEADRPYNQWPVAAGPVVLDSKTSDPLLWILLEDKAYSDWGNGKGCIPAPGVMIRVKGAETIDLAFCFECDMLFTFRGSQQIWFANIDHVHNQLLGHFVDIFKSDPDLPKLIRGSK